MAITVLNSSEGLVEFCDLAMQKGLTYRNRQKEDFSEDKESYFASLLLSVRVLSKCVLVFSKEIFVSRWSPEGGNRFDLKHPSYSERKRGGAASLEAGKKGS